LVAGILTAASLMPPLVKLIKDKKPNRVPVGMLIVLMCGVILWIVYGFLKMDWPIIITNALSLLQNIAMMVLTYIYKNNK
jgi:MtN3 and saliva related transmembrane protein